MLRHLNPYCGRGGTQTISRLHISANWKWCSQYFASFYFPIRCGVSCAQLLQSCPTLCSPMDCSHHQPPGSSVHGILQARLQEWVAMPFSRRSSWCRGWTCVSYVSCIGKWVLYHCTTWTAQCFLVKLYLWARVEDIKAHICEILFELGWKTTS